MRRAAALLLILTSGWLVYQTGRHVFDAGAHLSIELLHSRQFVRWLSHPTVFMPLLGGFLGLLGGVFSFFGGAGGGMIAVLGGLGAAAFAATAGARFTGPVWQDEMAVGATMLVLAIATLVLKRA